MTRSTTAAQPSLIHQYLCTICNKKQYKTFRGLIRHENLAHASYNQPSADIISLPAQHIEQFKKLLVNEIHKRLPLHYTKSGKQLIKFPCTDSEFVAVFGKQLNRFSPAKRTYQCIFKGNEAEAMLGQLLGDEHGIMKQTKRVSFNYIPRKVKLIIIQINLVISQILIKWLQLYHQR